MVLHNYHIPRDNLLNRTGDVTPDGNYVTPYKVCSKLVIKVFDVKIKRQTQVQKNLDQLGGLNPGTSSQILYHLSYWSQEHFIDICLLLNLGQANSAL